MYTVAVRSFANEGARRVGRLLAQHQDGHVDAGTPQLDPFIDEGHAEPGGACVERCPRHGDGAVAVPVRLHDHPHLARGDGGSQHADVVTHRVEVDVRPRPALWPTVTAPTTQCRRDQLDDVTGEQPPLGPERAGLGMEPGGRCSRARSRATPAASNAPIIPASTSPEPAVASRSSP